MSVESTAKHLEKSLACLGKKALETYSYDALRSHGNNWQGPVDPGLWHTVITLKEGVSIMLIKSLALLAILHVSCGKTDSNNHEKKPEEKKSIYPKIDQNDLESSEKKLKSILDAGEHQKIDVGIDFAHFYFQVSALTKRGIDSRDNLEYHCKKSDQYKADLLKKGLVFDAKTLDLEVCQSKYFTPL